MSCRDRGPHRRGATRFGSARASGTDLSGGFQHGYVWDCHIIDHEDNEMMRPDIVQLNPAAPAPAARPLKKGIDY